MERSQQRVAWVTRAWSKKLPPSPTTPIPREIISTVNSSFWVETKSTYFWYFSKTLATLAFQTSSVTPWVEGAIMLKWEPSEVQEGPSQARLPGNDWLLRPGGPMSGLATCAGNWRTSTGPGRPTVGKRHPGRLPGLSPS